MSDLDLTDPRPLWQQVVAAIREHIRTNDLSPGAKLPTHRQIADRYGVSVGTVKRAFAVLQTQGVIMSRQGEGAFAVDPRPPPAASTTDDRLAELRHELDTIHARLTRVEQLLFTDDSQGPVTT